MMTMPNQPTTEDIAAIKLGIIAKFGFVPSHALCADVWHFTNQPNGEIFGDLLASGDPRQIMGELADWYNCQPTLFYAERLLEFTEVLLRANA